MKRLKLLVIVGLALGLLFASSCKDKMESYNWPNPPSVEPVPTTPPSSSTLPYVEAAVVINGPVITGTVGILSGSSTGAAITGATVNINGTVLSEIMPGVYMSNLSTIAEGSTVTISITTSLGNVTATGTAPAAGTVENAVITGAASGSTAQITAMSY